MNKEIDKDELIASLQNENEMLKTILHMMPGNVYWKNLDGKYLGCNHNMAEVSHLNSPEDIVGKNNLDLFPNDVALRTNQIDIEVIRGEKEIALEELAVDKNNRPAIYLTQKKPFRDRQGQIKGLLGISFNITDRKAMEKKLRIAKNKAEAANKAKSEFLALVSHELRTPLTSILGFANFIDATELNEPQKKYIRHIINSGSYLLSLINNLLDFSRLEANKLEPFNQVVDLKKLIKDTLSMLSGSAKLKKLALKLKCDANVPTFIISDSRLLQQILVNLISNAIKFTHKGYVITRVSAHSLTTKTVKLNISVEDTGIGIEAKELKAIFKRFYQIGSVYNRDPLLTGTGLGLAIVKKLSMLLQGSIKVTSNLNVGSIFSFSATFKIPNKNQLSEINTSRIEPTPKKKNHILLVEDNNLIQFIHKQMLEELNAEVNICSSGQEALTAIESQTYDILFIDIGLPDIDGFELIRALRQISALKTTPIVALTGYSGDNIYQNCLRAGANELAIKPITKSVFNQFIDKYSAKFPVKV